MYMYNIVAISNVINQNRKNPFNKKFHYIIKIAKWALFIEISFSNIVNCYPI